MNLNLIKGIIFIPGTALVFIPALILAAAAAAGQGEISLAGYRSVRFWIALVLASDGLTLAAWTGMLFKTVGEGTPSPWDPPGKLVVRGPYRLVRNPMIAGVLLLLGAETLFFGSWYLALWLCVFFGLKSAYLVRVEEPELERRFGESYRRYKDNVPRWIPRLRPWEDGT